MERRVGYELKRAQQALRARMDEALRGRGMTTPQYAALSALEREDGLSNAELARRSFVTPQTMNGIVANLEAARLVQRRPHLEHGRIRQIFLTDPGRSVVRSAHPVVTEIERRMLAPLVDDERSRLLTALRACALALEADDSPADPEHP